MRVRDRDMAIKAAGIGEVLKQSCGKYSEDLEPDSDDYVETAPSKL